jgi:hypothetical protein
MELSEIIDPHFERAWKVLSQFEMWMFARGFADGWEVDRHALAACAPPGELRAALWTFSLVGPYIFVFRVWLLVKPGTIPSL